MDVTILHEIELCLGINPALLWNEWICRTPNPSRALIDSDLLDVTDLLGAVSRTDIDAAKRLFQAAVQRHAQVPHRRGLAGSPVG